MQDFTQHGWISIPNLVDRSLCTTLYQYCRVQSQRIKLKQQHDPAHYHKAWDGTFEDSQAPGNYALYGDPIQEVVMYQHLDAIRNCVDSGSTACILILETVCGGFGSQKPCGS